MKEVTVLTQKASLAALTSMVFPTRSRSSLVTMLGGNMDPEYCRSLPPELPFHGEGSLDAPCSPGRVLLGGYVPTLAYYGAMSRAAGLANLVVVAGDDGRSWPNVDGLEPELRMRRKNKKKPVKHVIISPVFLVLESEEESSLDLCGIMCLWVLSPSWFQPWWERTGRDMKWALAVCRTVLLLVLP
ncbi:hypothetical protein HOY80DRAFT_1031387 [Tuber brumale]|nr:hypothetical protein HOY80DRAFT_1031387 [Tuber brumale]